MFSTQNSLQKICLTIRNTCNGIITDEMLGGIISNTKLLERQDDILENVDISPFLPLEIQEKL